MKQNSSTQPTSTKRKASNYLLAGLFTLIGLNAMAQNGETEAYRSSLSLFSSPLFLILLGIIVLLVIFIAVFAGVLKDVAATRKAEKKASKENILEKVAVFLLLFTGKDVFAQSPARTEYIAQYIDIPTNLFYLLLIIIAFEILIITVLISLIRTFVKKEIPETEIVPEEPSFLEVMNSSVAVEDEHEILMDHEYDGIRELDNDLPPWWKYGFYLSILVSIIYLFNHHISRTGPLQIEEYESSLEKARIKIEAYQLMNANNVNENNATLLTDAADLENGKKIYLEMCFACHGKHGEGGVGPNLTDEYWLHGGSVKDIFSSIKYGWPNKGMKSWQADIPPVQIHQITSFIKTLKGTSPANAKEKQGELYTEIIEVADSMAVDSTVILSSIVEKTIESD